MTCKSGHFRTIGELPSYASLCGAALLLDRPNDVREKKNKKRTHCGGRVTLAIGGRAFGSAMCSTADIFGEKGTLCASLEQLGLCDENISETAAARCQAFGSSGSMWQNDKFRV